MGVGRLDVPRRIGWRTTAIEEGKQRYGVGIVHTVGGGCPMLVASLGLDAPAMLVIVWQVAENSHHRRLLMVR